MEAQNTRNTARTGAPDSTRDSLRESRPSHGPSGDVRSYCGPLSRRGLASAGAGTPCSGSFCGKAREALPGLGDFSGLMGCKLEFAPIKIYYAWTFY